VEDLTRSHPSLPAWLRSKQVALEVLTEQRDFLSELADAGRSVGSVAMLVWSRVWCG
jgi:hypothetical protein